MLAAKGFGGSAFENEAALHRPVGLDQALQSFARVEIHRVHLFRRVGYGQAKGRDQVRVVVDEFLGDGNVRVRHRFRVDLVEPFVLSRLDQVLTGGGAADGYFTLEAAAGGANFAAHSRAIAARAALLANRAGHCSSVVRLSLYYGCMSVTNLFFKVELEHDPGEDPQRIAGEIRRHILRLYGVRDVELSSVTSMEEHSADPRTLM